ncbi:uncharacterized protein [Halyomorpha halys]|uniref:uncharacterized protein n=1 Tax=Halyomorpha halys TaxID=286706 RepID=UPI0034D3743D
MDRLVRTTLTQERTHHPIYSTARLYLPRKEGERGLLNIEEACREQEETLRQYFLSKTTGVCLAITKMDSGLTALNLSKGVESTIVSQNERLAEWKSKSLHGRFYSQLNEAFIDKERSVEWLKAGRLFSETGGFVVAIQDQVIATRSYRKRVFKDATTPDKCRLCSVTLESIQHITGGCGVLAGNEYLQRYNHVAKILHQALAVKYSLIEDKSPYYKYHPNKLLQKGSLRLYRDKSIITDHTARHNKPNILLIDLRKKKAELIDVGIPNDNNIRSTVGEKLSK